MIRPGAHSFRAASWICTRQALAASLRSRPHWWRRCAGARRWHAEDLQPLCAKLGEENTGKTLVAVTALEQVGLIAAVEKGGAKYLELVPAQGKKNLADAPILKCLEGM